MFQQINVRQLSHNIVLKCIVIVYIVYTCRYLTWVFCTHNNGQLCFYVIYNILVLARYLGRGGRAVANFFLPGGQIAPGGQRALFCPIFAQNCMKNTFFARSSPPASYGTGGRGYILCEPQLTFSCLEEILINRIIWG
jgi:hypothetical protein